MSLEMKRYFTFLILISTYFGFGQNECLQGSNCVLPNCSCATFKHQIPDDQIPQMVYFAFDDEINPSVFSSYQRLFHPSRKNPNGCPITMTLFATEEGTDFSLMKQLYSMGMEIGAHGTVQMTNKDTILNETKDFKKFVSQKANIPIDAIVGHRSPYLATAGDDQIDALTANGFKYDISYTYTRRPESGHNAWPYTLDHGWHYVCNINPCPQKSHKGFWVVPINSMWDYMKSDICAYADSCTYPPPSANEMFKYLWSNFNNSYSNNRAPFGIHLHGRWLNDGMRLWAVDKFIRELQKLPDVYILSVNKMLEWMENPVRKSEINEAWRCPINTEVTTPMPSLAERCEQGVNCHLPNCYCDHLKHEIPVSKIPQMVYFAFDGPIDGTVISYFQTLFDHAKRNPNKCPLTYSVYITDDNTNYNLVKDLYDSGAEIGTNGLGSNYLATKESVLNEATKMKQNIVTKARVPEADIKGFRSPYLSTAGDEQVEALKETGYLYDISYTFTRRPISAYDAWPVTLDYGWPYLCNTEPCPEKSHKGFWEVPVNSLYDWINSDFCTFADECRNQPTSEDETYQYLMDNFMHSYRGNKAPFGVHLHPRWFHIHRYLRAVDRFINDLIKMSDVYIISVSDVIRWVKDPVSLTDINQFKNWKCPKVQRSHQRILPQLSLDCQNGENCKVPDCFCATLSHPMPRSHIPQMVYIAFDDDVNLKYAGYLFNLFSPNMKNPNNCPMTYTLFTIDTGTDYRFVDYFYQRGVEIAAHGVDNIPTKSKTLVLSEAGRQKQNILDNTNVTAKEVIGFRSPQLSTAGDDQIDVLTKLGYKYDASYTYTRKPETGKNAWPFTADYGWPWDCNIPPCPYYAHKGFWLVPVNSMWDYTKEGVCTFADECQNKPKTEKDVYDYLWNNFHNSYKGNKAPFGIHLHSSWFNDITNLKGMRHFLNALNRMEDVYVVSIAKMLEWMKNPTPLSKILQFGPWMCKSSELGSELPSTSTTANTPTTDEIILPIDARPEHSVPIVKPIASSATLNNMGVPITMFSKASSSKSQTFSKDDKITIQSTISTRSKSESLLDKALESVDGQNIDNPELNKGACVQGHSCKLPNCFCQGKSIPLGLPLQSVPQMVFMSFDGTLNHADHGPYLDLLRNRKNPNNCSVSATFYVNQAGSNSTAIKDMYDRGYEIAMRGYNVLRPNNASQLDSEIQAQMAELRRHDIHNIYGWKTVGYTSLTDDFKRVIQNYGFLYDSTNYYDNEVNLWPHTIDYGPSDKPLMWEIPNLALTDYLNVYQCQYADGCFNSPTSVNDTFSFLWNSFAKHYVTGNRAPFGVSLRKTWLSHAFYNNNLEGLKMFLDVILNLGDVYVVSTKQIMDWMKNPLPLLEVSKGVWACG